MELKYAPFIIYVLINLLIGCGTDNKSKKSNAGIQLTLIKDSSAKWTINQQNSENNKLEFTQKKNEGLKVGDLFYMLLDKPKVLEYIELDIDNNHEILFKLYVNGIYAGKFSSNQKIRVQKQIKSIHILLVKTGKEKIIEAWDEQFNYYLIQDSTGKAVNKPKIMLQFETARPLQFILLPTLKRKTDTLIAGRFKLFQILTKKNYQIFTIKDKNKPDYLEQIIEFQVDGSFYIYKSTYHSKELKYEYFFSGKWKDFEDSDKINRMELDGLFVGKSPENSEYQLKLMQTQIAFDNTGNILTNRFLGSLLMDLPNEAMVNIGVLDGNFIVEMPYATDQNITGIKLYSCNKCFLRYALIKDLLKAREIFSKKGLKIKLLDCYRPFDIQKLLYEVFPVYGYVADPYGGSLHNRGTAVDLTLTNSSGNELNMGSEYDELSERSHHAYSNFPEKVLQNRKLLRETMRACNFTTIRKEWWHYNHIFARKYPVLNDEFPCANSNTE